PFEKYRFRYAEGVAEAIAGEVLAAQGGQHDAPLLMQVICSQLYQAVQGQPARAITAQDLEKLGGVKGGIRAHAEALLDRLVKQVSGLPAAAPGEQAAGRTWLGGLSARFAPERSDRSAFKRLFRRLYLPQSDGRVTSALVRADDL